MKVSFCSKTDLGTRYPVNSDALGDKNTKNGHLFIVADGSPVDHTGTQVSKFAVQTMLTYFDKEQFENIYLGIYNAFQFVNEQLYIQTIVNNDLKDTHVSLALVLIRPEGAYYGHIGNAKIAIQSDDQLSILTKDHGFLEVQSFQSTNSSSKIVKALGNSPSVQPSICNSPLKANSGDVILLATNGLFKSFSLDDLNENIEYQTINNDIVSLIDKAKGRSLSDNLTVQLISVTQGIAHKNIAVKDSSLVSNDVNSFDKKQDFKEYFSNVGIERKRIIQVGSALIAFFLIIWFVFRSPKDDTNNVLNDAGEIVKADTTNPHQDLESIMEYENPKDKVDEDTDDKDIEEEEEENADDSENNDQSDDVQTNSTPDDEISDNSVEDITIDEPKKEEKKEPKKDSKKDQKKDEPKSSGLIHTVKSGDNLGVIAEKYHVKLSALKKANNIKNDQINVGQQIKIPN